MLAEAQRSGIGGEPMHNPDGPSHNLPSLYPPHIGPMIPTWLAYDKKVSLLFSNVFIF